MPSSGDDVVVAIAIAIAICALMCPAMVALAWRTGIVDHPGGYKRHARSTPYLGGLAILFSVIATTFLVAGTSSPLPAIAIAAAALCLLGTFDDWRPTSPALRVAAQAGIGLWAWNAGAGWETSMPGWTDAGMTAATVVVAANALNLIDNLDGTAAASAAGGAVGVAAVALAANGPGWSAILAAAVLGSCLGFLPFNLSKPARIFLGDGGSTLLGFLIAVAAMGALREESSPAGAAIVVLVLGIPLLDAAAAVVSRRQRGAPLLQGGRDHLTHRALEPLGSPARVAAVFALSQLALSGLALAAILLGPAAMLAGCALYGLAISVGLALLRGPEIAEPAMGSLGHP